MAILLAIGVIDFGVAFLDHVSISNAAREGARYASTNSRVVAWSDLNPADANTIQGHVQAEGGGLAIPNDPAHIRIDYLKFDPVTGSEVICASYAGGGVLSPPVAGCAVVGSLARVTVTYDYVPPVVGVMFGTGVPLTESATIVIHQ